jgi:hypothetical protein
MSYESLELLDNKITKTEMVAIIARAVLRHSFAGAANLGIA